MLVSCVQVQMVLGLNRTVERHGSLAGRDERCLMTLLCTATQPGDPLREADRELVLATDEVLFN